MTAQAKRVLFKLWNRISAQLYVVFGGAVVLIVATSLIALFFLDYIGEVQRSMSEESIPEMASAFAIARQTGKLVAAVPSLTAASTLDQFEDIALTIEGEVSVFKSQLSSFFEEHGRIDYKGQIQAGGLDIVNNIAKAKSLIRQRFDFRKRNQNLRDELFSVHAELVSILIREVDNQLFYTKTGYKSLDVPPAPRSAHFTDLEFDTYRRLAEIQQEAAVATELLSTAFTLMDEPLLEPLRERFQAAVGRANRSLNAIQKSELKELLSLTFSKLFSIGTRNENGFDLREQELRVDAELTDLLKRNRVLGTSVLALVERVVGESRSTAEDMASMATIAVSDSKTILLIVNILSIGGAIGAGWLLVHRHVITRLNKLSSRMRQMARGNLEIAIDIKGKDEIGELARALGVFRDNALEVQRLNLVEELADALQEKNKELEQTNERLSQAQDQIVMREKLAALGELTAGVAHEIKNPMNFIMNFSEVSQELLEELLEEVGKLKKDDIGKSEYDEELAEEIVEDLTGNLKRIHEHGSRANRIVMDMLRMGRGSKDWQMTNLNNLLNEHARLAFHSARAADGEFQLEIREDYQADLPEVEVLPQDLGRVFLNLVSNACYATNEKRRAIASENSGTATSYTPALTLKTRRVGDRVEIRVRDNGNGIPESALEKIFNPFYTTKPPDKGTGLGLSMSSDIARQHSGELCVETKEGEFTEMIVDLPVNTAVHRIADDDDESSRNGA